MKKLLLMLLLVAAQTLRAQTTVTGPEIMPSQDSVIVFTSPRPLLEDEEEKSRELSNSLGLTFSFSDYGIGGGFYVGHRFSSALNAVFVVDASQAKGSKEFGLLSENKVNRIYLLPLMTSLQYRVLEGSLGDNLRPFVTAGIGPVMVLAMPASTSVFSGLSQSTTDFTPGGFFGVGTMFGAENKSHFGANIRYYFIPYEKGIKSLDNEILRNFNALFLTVTYGYNF